MEPSIRASELRKNYGEVTAVDGVSLSVPPGTIFGVLGPNGAGKSTTVRMLCTLTHPDSGRAWIVGVDVLRDPAVVRRAIGVVGQKHGFDPEATGRENLVLQGEFYGMGGRRLKHRAAQSLERFGLAEAADRLAKTYSGGMQRRLDLAMGLLHEPQVLFLDEPTTGLDPEARVDMWREIERLAADERMTVLITTHYMDEADRLASRLAIIDRGQIVVEGAPEQLKSELKGDAIQIELDAGEHAIARSALDRVEGLTEIELDGQTLRARARDGGSAIPAVLSALESHGSRATSVTLARPSLDEVYLRHAGRVFHRVDAEAAEVSS